MARAFVGLSGAELRYPAGWRPEADRPFPGRFQGTCPIQKHCLEGQRSCKFYRTVKVSGALLAGRPLGRRVGRGVVVFLRKGFLPPSVLPSVVHLHQRPESSAGHRRLSWQNNTIHLVPLSTRVPGSCRDEPGEGPPQPWASFAGNCRLYYPSRKPRSTSLNTSGRSKKQR